MPLRTIVPVVSLFLFGFFVIASAILIRINADTPSTSLNIDNITPVVLATKLCSGTGDPVGCSHVSSVVLTGGTTTLYSISGTVRDENGVGDIVELEGLFYNVTTASNCGADPADPNNCYIALLSNTECTLTPINSTDASYECPILVEYYAEATDNSSLVSEGAYPSSTWIVSLEVADQEVQTHILPNNTEVNSLRDLSACASINYGTLGNGSSSSTGVNCAITNDGNVDIDIEVSGTAMTCSVGSIPVANQRVDITNSSYTGMGLSGTFQNYTGSAATYDDLVLNKRTAGVVSDDLYHTITVPYAVSGSCSGTNTISAIAEV